MPSAPPFDPADRQDTTPRIVKSGVPRADAADPVERYDRHFVHMIERHLSPPNRPLLALDLACGNGYPTLTLWPQLPQGSRVIAIGHDRTQLALFHQRIAADLRNVLFPRKQSTARLPFADGVFDVAWAALSSAALAPLKPSLRQALRALKPGGQLIVAAPLRDTFVHLASRLGGLLEAAGRGYTFCTLMTHPPDLLGLDGWQETLSRCGAVRVEGHKDTLAFSIDPPLSSDSLFTQQLLPLWLGNDSSLQTRALRLLDEHLTAPITVDVSVGCVIGLCAQADVPQSSATT